MVHDPTCSANVIHSPVRDEGPPLISSLEPKGEVFLWRWFYSSKVGPNLSKAQESRPKSEHFSNKFI